MDANLRSSVYSAWSGAAVGKTKNTPPSCRKMMTVWEELEEEEKNIKAPLNSSAERHRKNKNWKKGWVIDRARPFLPKKKHMKGKLCVCECGCRSGYLNWSLGSRQTPPYATPSPRNKAQASSRFPLLSSRLEPSSQDPNRSFKGC